jgi:hypothetical protein
MNGTAMVLGRKVYDKACAACHGADLKGVPGQHTPDLTDADWQFSGDDLASGGLTKLPSDGVAVLHQPCWRRLVVPMIERCVSCGSKSVCWWSSPRSSRRKSAGF